MAEAAGVERVRITGTEAARRINAMLPLKEVAAAAAVAILAMVLLVPVMRLDNASARVPFYYSLRGDGLFYGMTVRSIAEDGDMPAVARLGAPEGLDLRDFPLTADNLNSGLVRALSLLSAVWAPLV